MIDPDDRERFELRLAVLEAGAKLYEAHVENLIERVYELEQTIEVLLVKLRAVERATPLSAPKKPPPTTPRR